MYITPRNTCQPSPLPFQGFGPNFRLEFNDALNPNFSSSFNFVTKPYLRFFTNHTVSKPADLKISQQNKMFNN
jgi:hypothetical protein